MSGQSDEKAQADVDRWSRHLWHTSQHNGMPIFLGGRLQEQANAMRVAAGLVPFGWGDAFPDAEFGECSVHSDDCPGQETHGLVTPPEQCPACVAEAFAITSARDPHTCGLSTPPVRHERGCAADVAPGARCQCVTPPRSSRRLVSMLEDLETHAESPSAVLAVAIDLRDALGIPDRRDATTPPGAPS